jgi:hypothetical protein
MNTTPSRKVRSAEMPLMSQQTEMSRTCMVEVIAGNLSHAAEAEHELAE